MPTLQNLDHFHFVFVQAHKFSNPNNYFEPLLDKNWIPEPLPAKWHAIAKKCLMVRNSTTYEDPSFTRKIIRKFGTSGVPEYFIYVFDKN